MHIWTEIVFILKGWLKLKRINVDVAFELKLFLLRNNWWLAWHLLWHDICSDVCTAKPALVVSRGCLTLFQLHIFVNRTYLISNPRILSARRSFPFVFLNLNLLSSGYGLGGFRWVGILGGLRKKSIMGIPCIQHWAVGVKLVLIFPISQAWWDAFQSKPLVISVQLNTFW